MHFQLRRHGGYGRLSRCGRRRGDRSGQENTMAIAIGKRWVVMVEVLVVEA
ncbi:hypothetical protein [Lysobacter gummosus]|uniref:hypothetical protein n=1 Tax=Lysobacter gummosus TaxID=262324 RepID=UPI00363E48D5